MVTITCIPCLLDPERECIGGGSLVKRVDKTTHDRLIDSGLTVYQADFCAKCHIAALKIKGEKAKPA